MDATIRQACSDMVMNKIKGEESFTAYDITAALRADGHWVEHSDVKKYVHARMKSEIDGGLGYKKSVEPAGSSGATAVTYSPNVDDPDLDDFDDDAEPDDIADLTLSDLMNG